MNSSCGTKPGGLSTVSVTCLPLSYTLEGARLTFLPSGGNHTTNLHFWGLEYMLLAKEKKKKIIRIFNLSNATQPVIMLMVQIAVLLALVFFDE